MCAQQSVIQETLDASDEASVSQMHKAIDEIYRAHSQGYGHAYDQQLQILDVDMSGHLCGPKAAFATKGYFAAGKRNCRGRQLGRVLAIHYDEVVCDRTFDGTVQLTKALQRLISATEQTLKGTSINCLRGSQYEIMMRIKRVEKADGPTGILGL